MHKERTCGLRLVAALLFRGHRWSRRDQTCYSWRIQCPWIFSISKAKAVSLTAAVEGFCFGVQANWRSIWGALTWLFDQCLFYVGHEGRSDAFKDKDGGVPYINYCDGAASGSSDSGIQHYQQNFALCFTQLWRWHYRRLPGMCLRWMRSIFVLFLLNLITPIWYFMFFSFSAVFNLFFCFFVCLSHYQGLIILSAPGFAT